MNHIQSNQIRYSPLFFRKSVWLVAIYIFAVSFLLYLGFSHWAYDDPFITYRYANNLRQGLGFVYNPGERVLSTTTPLFVLLLTPLSYLWSDLPRMANMVGVFSLALGAIFLWDLAKTNRNPWAGWVALILYPIFPLLVTTVGSETPLYLAFCLGSFAFYARRNYPATAVFAALAVLTRPDGALVVVILVLDHLLNEISRTLGNPKGQPLEQDRANWLIRIIRNLINGIPWTAVTLFLLLTMPWFIFAWLYFGSLVPATLLVKQNQALLVDSQGFAAGFFTILRYYISRWHYLIAIFLASVGLIFQLRRERGWLPMIAWTGSYFFAYSFLNVSRYYWYYAPLVPAFIALVGLGVTVVLSFIIARLTNQSGSMINTTSKDLNNYSLNVLGVILFLLVFMLPQLQDIWHIRENPDNRYHAYKAVGQWLNTNASNDALVGALEVGILGYYAQRAMVDFAGIIQPEVANHLTPEGTYEDTALWAVDYYHLQYVILHDGGFPRLEKKLIAKSCTVEQTFSGSLYEYSSDLSVYACR